MGGLAEWSIAAVCYTVDPKRFRRFESYILRQLSLRIYTLTASRLYGNMDGTR